MAMIFPTSPTVGQVFTDGGRSWVWTGSTWDSPTATNTLLAPYGQTLIATRDFTAQTSFSMDGVFSSQFDFYKIIASYVADSNASNLSMRLRIGGVSTDANYSFNMLRNTGTSVSGISINPATTWRFGVARTTNTSISHITLANPAKTGSRKNYLFHEFNQDGSTTETNVGGGYNSLTTAHDGFMMLSENTTNFSGSIKVYGLRNLL
jgi:hypothetical protein